MLMDLGCLVSQICSRGLSRNQRYLNAYPDCVPKCWNNSRFVSNCGNEMGCLCQDDAFQGVSDWYSEIPAIFVLLIIQRLCFNAFILNARLLNSVQPFIMPFRNAPAMDPRTGLFFHTC